MKFLINEPIYLVKEKAIETASEDAPEPEKEVSPKTEIQSAPKPSPEVAEPTSVTEPPTKEEPAVVPQAPAPSVPSNKLLVIYRFEESEALPVHLKKLMLKIIEAVGIDVMQGVYVNHNFKAMPEALTDFENILIFSASADLSIEGYQMKTQYVTQVFGNTRVLVSDELPILDQQVPLKRKLWGVLQEMFPST